MKLTFEREFSLFNFLIPIGVLIDGIYQFKLHVNDSKTLEIEPGKREIEFSYMFLGFVTHDGDSDNNTIIFSPGEEVTLTISTSLLGGKIESTITRKQIHLTSLQNLILSNIAKTYVSTYLNNNYGISSMGKSIKVLVFGTCGTGKTSLCNTLTGQSQKTGDGVLGVTFDHFAYKSFSHNGSDITFTDTVGLNESDKGSVPSRKALMKLLSLLRDSKEGYNLLMHVFRIPRITETEQRNYEFFVKLISDSKIPVLLVANGCENKDPMSKWADENRTDIEGRLGLQYADIVCTSFAETEHQALADFFLNLRNESKSIILEAIRKHALPEPALLYSNEEGFWVKVKKTWNMFVDWAGFQKLRAGVNEKVKEFLLRFGFTEKEATELAENGLKEKNK